MRKIVEWLEDKLDGSQCENCPCYRYSIDYWSSDVDEYCYIPKNSYMDLHWYCLAPRFIKKLIIKYWERIEYKAINEYMDSLMDEESEENNDKTRRK